MAKPLYVPVLSWRQTARAAYRDLDPAVRGRIAPLWTVPPFAGVRRVRGRGASAGNHVDTAELRTHLAMHAHALLAVHHDLFELPGWVDASHVEDVSDATAVALWQRLEDSPLRPVTGPERAADDQLRAAAAARLAGGGLGTRILLDERPGTPHRISLQALVARVESAVPALDLLLDLGSVVSGAGEASARAASAIELFGELADWQAWQLVRATAGEGTRLPLVFGDYGVQHAQAADSPASGGPPTWVHLRYTVDDAYLVARAPFRSTRGDAARRAMARELVGSPYFRSRASRGEHWLQQCASGAGGSGNPGSWVRHGHTQHISFVSRQLEIYQG